MSMKHLAAGSWLLAGWCDRLNGEQSAFRAFRFSTPFLWKEEGPKGGGWPPLAVSKLFLAIFHSGTLFVVATMFL